MFGIVEKFITAATGPDPKNQKALEGSKRLADTGFNLDTFGPLGLFL